jgi:hypothetical protein
MQLLKELTRLWQLDSCFQPGWLEEGSPMMVQLPPGGGADAAVAAATAASKRNSPECGSWTAAISQAGLARGREPYYAAA